MRLLHTSDWHLGRRLHGQDLLGDQAAFLDWLADLAVAEGADAVLVSGDVYDRAQPGADAVALLDRALARFVRAGMPLIISSGNHDSAVRLQYGGEVLAGAGIHLRTTVEAVTEPVVLHDGAGAVGIYGIPYVVPDALVEQLGVARSHTAVLGELTGRIQRDARARELTRVVVMAHAFVTGAAACESEREIRVGGVGDVPAQVFDGFSYVALGHLHGPQEIRGGGVTTLVYSGSPLAFSFSERQHVKSVAVVDVDSAGVAAVRRVPTPVPRPLAQVRGRLEELLALAGGELAHLADAWVKAVLTDPGRVVSPMERLRERWPHTLVIEFEPERVAGAPASLTRLTEASDPAAICADFVTTVSGAPPSPFQHRVLVEAVHACQREEVSA